MSSYLFFTISAICGLLIIGLALYPFVSNTTQFWPPPGAKSWQQRTFLALFRGMFLSLIALTVLEFEYPVNSAGLVKLMGGVALILVGYGSALMSTYSLGWRNAFGDKNGLKVKGWYAYSRNPIYVAGWVGQVGWALVAHSFLIQIILVMWALMYLVAPFLEEPWLEKRYGKAFRDYKSKVPRFL